MSRTIQRRTRVFIMVITTVAALSLCANGLLYVKYLDHVARLRDVELREAQQLEASWELYRQLEKDIQRELSHPDWDRAKDILRKYKKAIEAAPPTSDKPAGQER